MHLLLGTVLASAANSLPCWCETHLAFRRRCGGRFSQGCANAAAALCGLLLPPLANMAAARAGRDHRLHMPPLNPGHPVWLPL